MVPPLARAASHGAIRLGRVALLVSAGFGSRVSAQAEPEPVSTAPAAAVRYAFELLDPEIPLVGIHVACVGDADGASEFTLNEGWAGLTDSGRDLELVEARGAQGILAHERRESFAWSVRHAPGEALELVFELGPTQHRASAGPPEYYLPILEPGLLHALGAQTLPAPTHLEFEAERPITLAWRGFEAAGWRTISSFGAEDELEVRRSLDDFRHALFLAGELRLEQHDVHGGSLWVAVHGRWSFEDAAFQALAARIVALGREFFADFEQPFYLISLIAVGVGGTQGSSYGGTGLSDSFALFLTPDMGLAPKPGGGGLAWLLAHELFHEWNGQTIGLEQPEQAGYWFSEGFTDFYARRLLLRGGLASPAQHLESWNHKLAAWAANPERAAPAARVAEAFWTSRDVGEVPYQRGDLIALYVDHAIRARSQGARSLDDLMRALVERARAGAGPYSNDELCAAIAEFAGDEAGAVVRRWALEGVEPELPPDAAGPEFVLEPAEVPTFHTGFDHATTLASGTVSGVVAGGCAERAGLRDGMRITGWSVNLGQTAVPVEVRVREDGTERALSYLPHGVPVRGYRLRARL